MKRAIISDIHSNLEAFKAVLADIDAQGIHDIYCLGDLVGYGPNPLECIDLLFSLGDRIKICLLGNHDNAVLFDPDGFNPVAEKAVFWTRRQLEEDRSAHSEERLIFFGERQRSFRQGDLMFVHGSPRNPLNEYVFADDIYDEGKMEKLFSLVPRYCFQGHTHVPGIFTEKKLCNYCLADLEDNRFELNGQKLMINVGSVGQPRDRDPRACYVVMEDDRWIEYRRIPYDIETTCQKIYDTDELDNFLGDRLKIGK